MRKSIPENRFSPTFLLLWHRWRLQRRVVLSSRGLWSPASTDGWRLAMAHRSGSAATATVGGPAIQHYVQSCRAFVPASSWFQPTSFACVIKYCWFTFLTSGEQYGSERFTVKRIRLGAIHNKVQKESSIGKSSIRNYHPTPFRVAAGEFSSTGNFGEIPYIWHVQPVY